MIQIPQLWIGTEADFAGFLKRVSEPVPEYWAQGRTTQLLGSCSSEHGDEEDDRLSMEERMALELIEVYDQVGVIEVKGSLVSDESPFNAWFGAVGYPTVARAVGMLLEDDEISSIVMAYATGGGSAMGISELSDSIDAAREVKPVHSWTGSAALSAGYWLGATGDSFRATKMAKIGSVGAVATFTSVYRSLKERGIDVYIARSSPKKALPHPLEPLTEAGKEQLQQDVEQFHSFFIDHIIAHRPGLSSNGAEKGWASGEDFFAAEALSLGMIDGPLIPLNSLIQELNANTETGDTTMPKHIVLSSERDRALLGAGVPDTQNAPDLADPQGQPQDTQPDEGTPQSGSQAADPQASGEGDNSGGQGDSNVSGGFSSSISSSGASSDLSSYLREEITQLREQNADLLSQIGELRTQVANLETVSAGREQLRPALEKAVERLHVALGHRPIDLKRLPDDALRGLFDDLNTELQALPTGTKSVQGEPSERSPEGDQSRIDDIRAQRLRVVPSAQ